MNGNCRKGVYDVKMLLIEWELGIRLSVEVLLV